MVTFKSRVPRKLGEGKGEICEKGLIQEEKGPKVIIEGYNTKEGQKPSRCIFMSPALAPGKRPGHSPIKRPGTTPRMALVTRENGRWARITPKCRVSGASSRTFLGRPKKELSLFHVGTKSARRAKKGERETGKRVERKISPLSLSGVGLFSYFILPAIATGLSPSLCLLGGEGG